MGGCRAALDTIAQVRELVSTDSLDDVRRAYPNYWFDARIFLAEMEGIL